MGALAAFDSEYLTCFERVVGVDEAGRGPLAGPVFAAALLFTAPLVFEGINDSKLLTAKKREALYEQLEHHPKVHYGVGRAEVEEIDEHNIHQASLMAMQRALDHLIEKSGLLPDIILVDGIRLAYKAIPTVKIIGGDGKSQRIAGASIIAKVLRDRLMRSFGEHFPHYGFERHMGYATPAHLEALKHWGPSPIHRTSFAPVRELLPITKEV